MNRTSKQHAVKTKVILYSVVLCLQFLWFWNVPLALCQGTPMYAVKEILVDPEPAQNGSPAVLCADVTNPTVYDHEVDLSFGVTPLGIGVPFDSVGDTRMVVPAGETARGCVTWTPSGFGPWSIEVILDMEGAGSPIWAQRNLDMDEPLEPGVPHSRAFRVGNPKTTAATITLGLIPHFSDWGLELNQDVLPNVAPGGERTVTLTVTPPAVMPDNGAPIVDVEGYIAGELIGGFRKIYTTAVEDCEGDFDDDGDQDGLDAAYLASHPGEMSVGLFAPDYGRTDCPRYSPFDAMVIGRIVCPGPATCSGSILPDAIRVEVKSGLFTHTVSPASDFTFSIRVPNGSYDLVILVDDPDLLGPSPVPLTVGAGDTFDAGDIELLLKDAWIQGKVVDSMNNPLAGVQIVGSQPEGWARVQTVTNLSGEYTLPVIGGEWSVKPDLDASFHMVWLEGPRMVRLAPGGTMTDVDFELVDASALIHGVAKDMNTSSQIQGLRGTALADWLVVPPEGFEPFSQAPLIDGLFSLKAQLGWDFRITLDLPPQASYVSRSQRFFIGNPVNNVEMFLYPKDAVIQGTLIDALTLVPPVDPVEARVVGADAMGNWASEPVAPDNTYALGVTGGAWELWVEAQPESGYVPLPAPVPVLVPLEGTAVANLEIQPINSIIGGRVVAPDLTTPEPGVRVVAQGISPFGGEISVETVTNQLGEFELVVREGTYDVTASLPPAQLTARNWLNPTPLSGVTVSASSPSLGWDLPFRFLDGQITGTVYFNPGITFPSTWMPDHPALVVGLTDSGDWVEIEAPVVAGTRTFSYSLPVLTGETWRVTSVYEDGDNGVFYESSETGALVPNATPIIENLELYGPYTMPQPLIVSFDGSQMQTIVMPDGVALTIPAGALLSTGASNTSVTLFIFTMDAKTPYPGGEFIGPGYEIRAVDADGMEITGFTQDVTMTFAYPADATLESQGISEYHLIPMYFSSLAATWILPKGYEVHTVNNEIEMSLYHF